MRGIAQHLVRFGRGQNARLYYVACVCLLVVAVGLRFHDLSAKPMGGDEAVAAHISQGELSAVIHGTGCCNSSPILYPLVLYAVQQVRSTPFSVRAVPATASVLVVAVMLLLLPRVGVARGAAFLAALLATLSVAAIRNAQDGREYSVDALLAVLMVAGLLRQMRDGKTGLLCASLLIAPLVQYGLVLFGVAVIGAAALAPRVSRRESGVDIGGIGAWLKPRLGLAVPCGFFLTGSVVSYLVTLRYQWQEGGFASDTYLLTFYYQGGLDAYSIFEFSFDGVWRLLTYHLPDVIAMAALPALAILLVASMRRKPSVKLQDGAIVALFWLCIAISVGAGVLGAYPLGGTRQVVYLGPVVFLAIGVAFHWTADCLYSLTGRTWATPALLVMTGGTALAGTSTMLRDDPYRTGRNVTSVLAVLKERVREEDVVFLGAGAGFTIRFHLGEEGRPRNWYYKPFGECTEGTTSLRRCLREMADLAYWLGVKRIWFVAHRGPGLFRKSVAGLSVENVVSGGVTHLYLIEDAESLVELAGAGVLEAPTLLGAVPNLSEQPPAFDVYLGEGKLIYFKAPCRAKDLADVFFLHVYPSETSDLSEFRGEMDVAEFENLDFRFDASGVRAAERCVVLQALPGYEFARVSTGQYNDDGRLWERDTQHNGEAVLASLKARVRKNDMVYLGTGAAETIGYHLGREERPANWYYGTSGECTEDAAGLRRCLREMVDLAGWLGVDRVWFVTHRGQTSIGAFLPGLSVEQVVSGGITDLHLVEDAESLVGVVGGTGVLDAPTSLGAAPNLSDQAAAFDVYLGDGQLIYVKDPCGAEDVRDTFFLHAYPSETGDLSEPRGGDGRRGFENLDFRFDASGVRAAERCVVLQALPGYEFARISTGQYNDDGRLWERDTQHNGEAVLASLKARVRKNDMVYLGTGAAETIGYHLGREERPANWYYGTSGECTEDAAGLRRCLREMVDLAGWLGVDRVWFVTHRGRTSIGAFLPGLSVEQVVSGGITDLHLVEDAESLVEVVGGTGVLPTSLGAVPNLSDQAPAFDVYLGEGQLIYVKDPCGAEDVRDTFFLHVYPSETGDLSEPRGFGQPSGASFCENCPVTNLLTSALDSTTTKVASGKASTNSMNSQRRLASSPCSDRRWAPEYDFVGKRRARSQ